MCDGIPRIYPRCAERLPDYIAAMERRGRKPLSLESMERGCRRCAEILEAVSPGIRTAEVGEEEIVQLQQELLKRFKENTARSYIEKWGGFSLWETGVDQVRRARLMWNGKSDVERLWLTAEDYARLYAVARPRERVMLTLGATMGLRREEIMSLTMQQIRNGAIEVHGKGHGPRGKVVVKEMSGAVREALIEWLPERERILREHRRESDELIVSWCGKGMDKSSMCWTMRWLGEQAGVKVTPHSLRRLYATTMADAEVPLETMARMMRHSSPTTTMTYYLREDPRRMKKAQDAVDAVLCQ